MKNVSILFVCSALLFCTSCLNRGGVKRTPNIIVEGQLATTNYQKFLFYSPNEEGKIIWTPAVSRDLTPKWQLENDIFNLQKNKIIHWGFYSDKPLITQSALLGGGILVSPGDSIHIVIDEQGYHYSGKGATAVQFQHDIEKAQKSVSEPEKFYVYTSSIDDYLQWKKYLDKRLELIQPILDMYKDKVSENVYDWVKTRATISVERERVETFICLIDYYTKKKPTDLRAADLKAIGDTTLNNAGAMWLREKDNYNGDTWYYYQYNQYMALKKYDFDFTQDSLSNDDKRKVMLYNALKENYKGQLRERLLQYAVANNFIRKKRKNPVTDQVVKDYYAQPGFPEYKQWMHRYEDSVKAIAKN